MNITNLALFSLGVLFFASCSDDLSTLGSSVRPSGEDLDIKSSTMTLESRTFKSDSVYARTSVPLLGEIVDKFYGTIRSDYAGQFYVEPKFNLDIATDDSTYFCISKDHPYGYKDSLVNNALDSIVLSIYYNGYIGDSLTPMTVTAYELEKKLPKNFYSNMDIEKYIPSKKELGKKTYTGIDMTISDSIKNTSSYVPYVDIKLSNEFAKRFYKAITETPEVFNDQESFQEFFQGVYLKSTQGNGTIIKVIRTDITMFYRTYHNLAPGGAPLVGASGKDSSYVANRVKYIGISPDVVQVNSVRYTNEQENEDKIMNCDSATYVTSPAGYFTEIDIPVGKIAKERNSFDADKRFVNGISLNVQAYKPVADIFYSTPPSYMLLVRRDKMNEFFEQNSIPDSKESFAASYASDSTSGYWRYNFGNINRLVIEYVKKEHGDNYDEVPEDAVIKMAMVPVSATINSYGYFTKMTNFFSPSGVVLKSGKNPQKTTIIYTLQNKNDK